MFGSDLEWQTLTGTLKHNPVTKKIEYHNKLDSKKLDYIYEQYKTRVLAVGINVDDRNCRSARTSFNQYVIQTTDAEHQKRRRRQRKGQDNKGDDDEELE